ncbi:non-ribosomal peptide synthetase [Arthrobacter sp. IA7]|uniref:non-ribosomal peptide synthetase n=1 Tax=Arthrobacter ipis TaxID=2716202 RepID=UPI001686D802|nr:amino acid adenylation domain-containing protein [Arthrobacter ipis]MBD1543534.1 non-ribosomal peptide synthetase [Arthrobacter ipis]
MTATSALTCRTAADHPPGPGKDRSAPAGAARTVIPRWARERRPGQGRIEVAVPQDLRQGVRTLSRMLDATPESIWMAAHARVLQALSGETEVTTGCKDASGTWPCELDLELGSWHALVSSARIRQAQAHAERAGGPQAGRPPVSGTYEVVFSAGGDGGSGLAEGLVLGVSLRGGDGGEGLSLRYRRDVLDEDAALRIAGYHLSAVRHLVADPGSDPAEADLVGPGERRFQLEQLAGPGRSRPQRRFHELFEERVRQHPERIAAVQDAREWTYAELNARANRIARALDVRGLRAEDIVAVVAERDLEWMAAVIGILKAGGAYLPIEPHFPADRIGRTLTRAGARVVLTEGGSTATLDEALEGMPAVTRLLLEDIEAEGHAADDPGLEVRPDQLAYVYFTSGSTGEPKGAMCEHDGMVNHLYAKVEDLGIRPGDVVAQSAPQCFDISLWQLLSALLVGGRTLIVGQDRILDVERFIDTVERGAVAVFQVVPSYLDAVVAYLGGKPRALPHLRCVSATGEALKGELVRRWFDVMPNVKLVNAYGLTETSDDTNHEVMSAAPAGGSVPLGPPIPNVRIHILDERGRLVPLGAPGEIAFSGVCVGRGYINDPERTAQAYTTDPYVDGARLYRAGDYGRWSPDGKLEYLGRRDNQVKISGFRIEIGDIENALLRVPGVRDGAVVLGEGTVVGEGSGQSRFLVAFYSGHRPLEADHIRSAMATRVPGYMVPSTYRWQENLPLTGNGKIDRKALTRMAREVLPEAGTATETLSAPEQRLAQAWASVLGLPAARIGRQDSFFALGGTSLSAVKLAVLLKRAVTIKDIMQTPVLADLAALLQAPSLADAAVAAAPRPAGALPEPGSIAPAGGPAGRSHPLPLKGKDL